jgi:Cu/Zn superoxide dismutase
MAMGGAGGARDGGGAGAGGAQDAARDGATAGDGAAGTRTAVAKLMSTGQAGLAMLSGTATFTQMGTQVKLVIELENCPMGNRATHLHDMPNCGNGGNAAGNHWTPNGEGIGEVKCDATSKGRLEFMRGTNMWTIGGAAATDITRHALIVHRGSEASPGDRIACGLIVAQ